jgi:hypothetical protein
MGAAQIVCELTFGAETTAAAIADGLAQAGAPELAANKLANLLSACASGMKRARMRLRVTDVTGVRATGTLVCTAANIAAAEYIEFVTPIGRFRVTCVASGAVDGDATFDAEAVDADVATNIRQAINTHPQLKQWVSASGATNNVIVTAVNYGPQGNLIEMVDGTTNGVTGEGLLTGGKDPAARVTSVITCVAANTDADDTIRIGKTTLTAKAGDASGESQFNIGANNTAMGDNLLAKIIAHSDLVGLVEGVNASGVVTLTWLCDPRVAVHAGYMVTSDADGIATTTQPTTTLTLSSNTSTRSYNLGLGES